MHMHFYREGHGKAGMHDYTYMRWKIYYTNAYKPKSTHICIQGCITWMYKHWHLHTHMHSMIYYMTAYKMSLTYICIEGYTSWMHMNLHSHIYAFNDISHECICTSIEKAVVRLGCTITHICIERYTTRMHIDWNRHIYAFKDVLHECINTDTHTHMHSRKYYMKTSKTTITHIHALKGILHECIYHPSQADVDNKRQKNSHKKRTEKKAARYRARWFCLQIYKLASLQARKLIGLACKLIGLLVSS